MKERYLPRLPLGFGVLALAHLLIDMHSGMVPVILLYQRETLRLSLAQVGVVAGIYSFSISLTQPLFGHLADRFGERRFALGGVLWTALLGGALGFAPSFEVLVLLAGLTAIGPAAFHPPAAAGASRLATSGRGSGMSVFLVGGSSGHALGPLIAASVFEITGLHGTAWIALGALTVALGLAVVTPFTWPPATTVRQSAPSDCRAQPIPISRTFWAGVATLLIVTGVRTWVHRSLATYLPQQLVALGFLPAQASRWLALMLASVALGVLAGGPLTDRFGPRVVITSALVMLAPVVILFSHATALPVGLLIGSAGLLVGVPLPMTIVIGQSFLPEGTGLASGVVLGTSFVAGAAGVALTGVIADNWGFAVVFMVLGVLTLIAALAGLALPKQSPGQRIESSQSVAI